MDQDEQLWEKIKEAKAHLFTQTNFLCRYGSSGLNVHNEPQPLDETGPSSGSHNQPNTASNFSLPSVVVTGPSPSPTELPHHSLSSETRSQGKQADQGDTHYSRSRETQTPRSWTITAQDTGEETSSESGSSLATVVPVAPPSSSTKKQTLPSQRASQDKVPLGKNNLDSVKAKHSATSKEATSRPVHRMSATDSSDEVMLRNGRFRVSSGILDAGSQSLEASDQGAWSNQQDGFPSPKHVWTDSGTNVSDLKELGLEGVDVSPGRASADDGFSQSKLASSIAKKDPNKAVPMSPKEELEMLQKQILMNAHMNRFKDFDTPSINPEVLAKARDGPGTDTNSEVYCEFMRRAAPQEISSSSKSSAGAQSASGQSKASQEGTWVDLHDTPGVPYSESPAIYPAVENGQIILSSEPTSEVQLLLKVLGQEFGLSIGNEDLREADQAPEHNWGDPFYADWEYRPRVCSNFAAFRDWFRRWLDTTMQICCHTDIYHPTFFDGTAHSDGMKSFIVSDVEYPITRLDVSDEENRLHSHETVEGYCHNWARHVEREEEEKKARKARVRAAYTESIKSKPVASPRTSKPNYYLRPVEYDDIPELLVIMNWFIENSTLTVDVSLLETEHVRERIETAKREMLPFLVAAERRPAHSRDGNSRGLLGYALATDTAGDRTAARFTVELELFVRDEHRQRGIGKCLMDKLVEVCDPTYIIKGGYFFDSSWEDRPGYRAGGRRYLARLLLIISFPNNEREQYKWLQKWLERDYGFEQQGLLKGTRVKFNRFLSSSYIVREVGCVDEDTFRN